MITAYQPRREVWILRASLAIFLFAIMVINALLIGRVEGELPMTRSFTLLGGSTAALLIITAIKSRVDAAVSLAGNTLIARRIWGRKISLHLEDITEVCAFCVVSDRQEPVDFVRLRGKTFSKAIRLTGTMDGFERLRSEVANRLADVPAVGPSLWDKAMMRVVKCETPWPT